MQIRKGGSYGYVNLDEEAKEVDQLQGKEALASREQEKQTELWNAYSDLLERYARNESGTIDELMAFRVHAATEGINIKEQRIDEARKEAELAKRRDERRRSGMQGQSVQEFYKELNKTKLEDFQAEQEDRKEIGLPVIKKETSEEKFKKIQQGLNQSVSIPKIANWQKSMTNETSKWHERFINERTLGQTN